MSGRTTSKGRARRRIAGRGTVRTIRSCPGQAQVQARRGGRVGVEAVGQWPAKEGPGLALGRPGREAGDQDRNSSERKTRRISRLPSRLERKAVGPGPAHQSPGTLGMWPEKRRGPAPRRAPSTSSQADRRGVVRGRNARAQLVLGLHRRSGRVGSVGEEVEVGPAIISRPAD